MFGKQGDTCKLSIDCIGVCCQKNKCVDWAMFSGKCIWFPQKETKPSKPPPTIPASPATKPPTKPQTNPSPKPNTPPAGSVPLGKTPPAGHAPGGNTPVAVVGDALGVVEAPNFLVGSSKNDASSAASTVATISTETGVDVKLSDLFPPQKNAVITNSQPKIETPPSSNVGTFVGIAIAFIFFGLLVSFFILRRVRVKRFNRAAAQRPPFSREKKAPFSKEIRPPPLSLTTASTNSQSLKIPVHHPIIKDISSMFPVQPVSILRVKTVERVTGSTESSAVSNANTVESSLNIPSTSPSSRLTFGSIAISDLPVVRSADVLVEIQDKRGTFGNV